MTPISFFVPGTPKAQPRVKAFARKFGPGKYMARVYTPGTAEEWKSQIAIAARPYIPFMPIEGPVRVTLEYTFPRPKAHLRKNGTVKEGAPLWHTSKPDTENCNKAVYDALTQLGMWKDDAQVCSSEAVKGYGPVQGVMVVIDVMTEPRRESAKGVTAGETAN